MSMRILILSWEYPPIVEGGLSRHVRKLSDALVALGVEVHVVTRGGGHLEAVENRHGVIVHRVREPEYPRNDLDAFILWVDAMNDDMERVGRELCDGLPFDVVHSHDWLVARAAERLARSVDRPWLVTVHATEYGRHQGWVGKHPQAHIHRVEQGMARRADHVITCSHYMRGHVADVFDISERRVSVIPNGIDPLDLDTADQNLEPLRRRFAAPDERLVLLIGRLVYEKGFHLALEALPGLIERLGKLRFLVAGSGTAEAELRRQAERLSLLEHGTFLGWIGDDVLHSLYRISDLCVVPSIYEPFGIVALEAMASGCLCVVADTGGLREVVPGDDSVGLRFRSRDPSSLAKMVERVLTDAELRDRLVTQASEHVARFDWTDVARRTAAVYSELSGVAAAAPAAPAGGIQRPRPAAAERPVAVPPPSVSSKRPR